MLKVKYFQRFTIVESFTLGRMQKSVGLLYQKGQDSVYLSHLSLKYRGKVWHVWHLILKTWHTLQSLFQIHILYNVYCCCLKSVDALIKENMYTCSVKLLFLAHL